MSVIKFLFRLSLSRNSFYFVNNSFSYSSANLIAQEIVYNLDKHFSI